MYCCTGVSSWEGRKPGKQADSSVAGPEPTPRPSKERKRRSGGGVSSRVKRQRAVCILVPLAILLVLGGIGAAIGITMSQQKAALAQTAPAAAEAERPPPPTTPGPPLVFKVNVTVPPGADGQPGPSCSDLVGPRSGKGKMEVGVCDTVTCVGFYRSRTHSNIGTLPSECSTQALSSQGLESGFGRHLS